MKKLKYILPVALVGLMLAACDNDDNDNYGVLDGLGVVYRSQSINDGATVKANGTTELVVSYNNLIQLTGSGITVNGTQAQAHTSGMDLVIELALKSWTEYTVTIPEGIVARADDSSITAEGRTIKFDTNQGLNLTNLDKTLVNSKATAETKKLYEYLLSIYGEKQLTGAMGAVGWGTEYTDMLYSEVGKYPAIVGFDYLHLPSSPSNWIDYGDITPVKAIHEAGGIIQIQWHWNVPTSQGTQGSVTTVWEGEKTMPSDWSGYLQLTDEASLAIWARAKVGDYIDVATKDVNTGANAQGSLKNSNWTQIGTGTEYFNISGDYSHVIDEEILTSLQSGGLIVSGHDYTVTKVSLRSGGTSDGSMSFSASGNNFNPANVYVEGTWENSVAKADIEKLAGYLSLLQDAKIPVLWRPFHEAAGDYTWGAWFWWGTQGTEVTKKLYKYLYDQLTNVYGINNLIWVWTMCTSSAGQMADMSLIKAAYPGDDCVDIVGVDLYPSVSLTDQSEQFFTVNDAVDSHKMVALTECGNLVSPETAADNDALWLYFMQWYDMSGGTFGHTNYEGQPWSVVADSPYTLFIEDLPSLK